MTKSCLNPDQRRTVEIIEALGFGVIERLFIRGGLPCYEPEPRIVQAIKLDSEPERQPDHSAPTARLRRNLKICSSSSVSCAMAPSISRFAIANPSGWFGSVAIRSCCDIGGAAAQPWAWQPCLH